MPLRNNMVVNSLGFLSAFLYSELVAKQPVTTRLQWEQRKFPKKSLLSLAKEVRKGQFNKIKKNA